MYSVALRGYGTPLKLKQLGTLLQFIIMSMQSVWDHHHTKNKSITRNLINYHNFPQYVGVNKYLINYQLFFKYLFTPKYCDKLI